MIEPLEASSSSTPLAAKADNCAADSADSDAPLSRSVTRSDETTVIAPNASAWARFRASRSFEASKMSTPLLAIAAISVADRPWRVLPVSRRVTTSPAESCTAPSAWTCATFSDNRLLDASSRSTPFAASPRNWLTERDDRAAPVSTSVTSSSEASVTFPKARYWATVKVRRLSLASSRSMPLLARAATSATLRLANALAVSASVTMAEAGSDALPSARYWATESVM